MRAQLLSNGRYTVMLTGAGSGFSRWKDLAITRWREDPTCDDCGNYVLLRDADSGAVWSARKCRRPMEQERNAIGHTTAVRATSSLADKHEDRRSAAPIS